MDRPSKQKINKDIAALNETLDKMYLFDIFRTFHPKATEYTYFSSAPGMFTRIDHIPYKTSLNNFKKTEIISSIFSDYNATDTRNQSQEQ